MRGDETIVQKDPRPQPMPRPPDSPSQPRRPASPEPLRRKRAQPVPISAFRRKPFQILVGFVTLVLLIDALVGERGLMERLRARHQHGETASLLAAARTENARLREKARRLKEDSS